MNEQQTVEWLIEEKLADNVWQAQNICRKLHLGEMDSDEAQKARCRLYREWRRAGENRDAAAIKAIAGEAAPERLISDAECICGYDPTTGYRRDIVCPVHDNYPASERLIADEPAPLTGLTGEELAGSFDDAEAE